MTLTELLSSSQVVTFEPGKSYIVFIDRSQIDPNDIIDAFAPDEINLDVRFVPVEKLPGNNEDAVKAYEVMYD